MLNADLMRQLDAELRGRQVRFTWVKGHAGHPLNEAADSAARAVATAYQQHQPIPEGPGFPGADSGSAVRGAATGSSSGSGNASGTNTSGTKASGTKASAGSGSAVRGSSAHGTQDTLF